MIFGMHRSGTSSLAGSLQKSGLYLGDVFVFNPHNLKGNRENKRILKLNNNIFQKNSGDWSHPPEDFVFDQEDNNERDLIIDDFCAKANSMWGFKDPKLVFIYSFWKTSLPQANLVGTFRHPLSVATSLLNRNNLPLSEGFKLWYSYNLKLLQIWEEQEFPIISFDNSADDCLKNIKRLVDFLELKNNTPDSEVFFDPALR